ncbi:MAG: putative peptidase [Myxococcota bacterium]|jgi:predicted peptidase
MDAGLHPQIATVSGRSLRYTLSTPATPAAGAPLVLCLHYAGHGAPWYGQGLLADLIEPSLRSLNAVMVAPDCPERSWTSPAAAPLVFELLDTIAGQHGTDPRRVVVTGYSMGGIGTWHYAAAHSERFSAAIPIAGRPSGLLPSIPVYIVHSRRDEVIDIGPDEAAAASLAASGSEVVFEALSEPVHYAIGAHAAGLAGAPGWLKRIWSRPHADLPR